MKNFWNKLKRRIFPIWLYKFTAICCYPVWVLIFPFKMGIGPKDKTLPAYHKWAAGYFFTIGCFTFGLERKI